MNPRLRIEVGRLVNFEYEIPSADEGDPVWLGRGAFCKIRIPDGQLSRRHCQFTFEKPVFFVEDLGSQNGTRVNGALISAKTELHDGDRITVGNHELVVIMGQPAKPRAVGLPELGTQDEEEEALSKVTALLGTEFVGYMLERIIFTGDSSVIFRGRDPQTNAPVAVKVLKPLSRVTVEDQNRFIRGAKHSAVLKHPNFVRVYKGGRLDDWFFVVMEYVSGRNLQHVVERKGGPLELGVALRIIRQVLSALQHAYEANIVYRAARPDNVILAEGLLVKLTDFDLIKPLSGRQEAQVTRVMDGSLKVDPCFAAPELIAYPVVADQKADVFGAGAILYFMLCAQPPFGKLLPADKLTSAFERIPRRPSEVNPLVPEPLSAVILQAMSDYERYNTPSDMLEAVERAAAEGGSSGGPA
jgi:serine/threonine-protein kinase